jgi:hypothetical protein
MKFTTVVEIICIKPGARRAAQFLGGWRPAIRI